MIIDSSEACPGVIAFAWQASVQNNWCPPEPVFIFVNIPITSDQSVWSQPSRLISTYQLCQHPLSSLAVTLIVTLSLNLLITFGSHCEKIVISPTLVHTSFFPLKYPHSVLFKSYNPCHKLGRKSIIHIFPVSLSLLSLNHGKFRTALSCQIFSFFFFPFSDYFQYEFSPNSNDPFFSDHFFGVPG